MPSTSKKQRNFMAAAAHSPAFAKKVGVPMSVAKEFNQADKGRKFREGGAMKKMNPFMEMIAKKKEAAGKKDAPAKKMAKGGMHEDVKMDKKVVKKAVGMHEKQLHGGKKSNLTKLKSGGSCKGYSKGGGIETKGKTKGRMC
jgi:hypothetical protein